MKAHIRLHIQEALARVKGKQTGVIPFPDIAEAVERAVTSGEHEYTIKEIADNHKVNYHTVYRYVKGKPGYRVYGKRRGVRVTASLYRSFLADAMKRGLAA